jgi:hypothetical protein
MRWIFKNDWCEWDARIGDSLITIEQKWKGEPDLWEIRCNGITVNARTTWPGDYYRWKLNDGRHQFNWAPRYANIHDEWQTRDRTDGGFQIYTYWEGDPREWEVIDDLPDDVSMAMLVALIFLAIHFSTPRI